MEGRSHDHTSPFEEDEHSRLYNRSMALLFTVENISLWRQIIPQTVFSSLSTENSVLAAFLPIKE